MGGKECGSGRGVRDGEEERKFIRGEKSKRRECREEMGSPVVVEMEEDEREEGGIVRKWWRWWEEVVAVKPAFGGGESSRII